MQFINRIFKIKERNTRIKTEAIAGLTTFMTMAYILVVNPVILSKTGMDFNAIITATGISAAVATLVMAFAANLPIALAPGMGLNAFFAYTVVIHMGYSWQLALTAVFIEGLIFILLTILNVRQAIIKSIPNNIKQAISVGIGFFIAFIGLSNAGIVKTGMRHTGNGELSGTIVELGNLTSPGAVIAMAGLLLAAVLMIYRVKGALLIGILGATLLGIPLGITTLPDNFAIISAPPSLKPLFFQMDFSNILSWDMAMVLFVFLFVDLFDTVGTLVGLTTKTGLIDKEGNIPNARQALLADSIGTTAGALLGTSTVTAYIESASGMATGGKTGLTALVVALLFLLALFISPIIQIIPTAATAPALILVGYFMISPIKDIIINDYTESIPAFLTIVMMPLAYSIADGIVFGVLSYIFLKLAAGKRKQVSLTIFVIGVFFIIRFFVN